MPTSITAPEPARPVVADVPDPSLLRIRDLIYKVAGIYQPQDRLYSLQERCARRFQATRAKNAKEYFDILTASSARESELRNLLNEITVGETCLFRGPAQIDALRDIILPELTSAGGGIPRKIRVWSAGCSTGEEPYTYAMFFLEEFTKRYPNWPFEIVATDLNERSLEKAKAGVYGDYATRNTPELYLKKYFEPADGLLRVKPEVRAKVSFNRLNLADDNKMLFMKGFDLISCCNVLIYFDGGSKTRVINHFYSNLLAGGYFFLGLAESLFGLKNDFRLIHFPQATAYHKPRPGAAVKP
jgi:chemotaxis protein methyltransferase CheR